VADTVQLIWFKRKRRQGQYQSNPMWHLVGTVDWKDRRGNYMSKCQCSLFFDSNGQLDEKFDGNGLPAEREDICTHCLRIYYKDMD
jgi:hypothetical protein